MNKTIKVIDLLNKIANREEAPKEISIDGYNYMYHKEYGGYYRCVQGSNWIALTTDFQIIDILNKLVYIEEEQQDIDIQEIGEFDDKDISTEERLKIDQLIQAVKQLDKQIKEKE